MKRLPAEQLSRALRERDEARAFQAATNEILTAISRSTSDAKPVFDGIVDCVRRLFGTRYAAVFLVKGEEFHLAAAKSDPSFRRQKAAAFRRFRESFPQRIDWRGFTGKALRSGKVSQMAPVVGNPRATRQAVKLAKEFGYNAVLLAPLMREGKAIGAIGTTRPEAKPFATRELALFKAFAAQAVIAIENARLFNETKEALEQQTATSGILRVISSSPGDIGPVLDVILENGLRLCEARHGSVFTFDGEAFHVARSSGQLRPDFRRRLRSAAIKPGRETPLRRVGLELRPVHCVDLRNDPSYSPPPEYAQEGFRTALAVPVLKEGKLIGALAFHRREVRPFSDTQIALLQTFADQAVIAIENARLFNETKEALERQTATAEILKVISSSPTATQPVFESIVQKCHALFEGSRVGLWQVSDGRLFPRASTGYVPEPMPIDRESAMGACILETRTIHLPDLEAGAERYPRIKQLGLKHGYRSGVYAPLLREGRAIGGISVLRPKAGAFSDREVELLTTFADQAVIAIENARLFNETREALERQTATAEILKVISSTPTDVRPVFDAIVRNAVALCEAKFANAFRYDGEMLHFLATTHTGEEYLRALKAVYPMRPDRSQLSGRAILSRSVERMEDALADPEYERRHAVTGGWRKMLGVPLLRDANPVGVIVVAWEQAGPVPHVQEALLKTFADQAAIAIENARLFNETKEALERQTATAEILKVIAGSPSNAQPVFDAIASSALRLFDGLHGMVVLVRDDKIALASHVGPPGLIAKLGATMPIPLDRESLTGRVILDRKAIGIGDVEASGLPEFARTLSRSVGMRALLGAPMLREGKAIGAIVLARETPGEFNPKQVALLETFADQAVIAIENARLFSETKEALERQTAISEVLRVISSSPADVQPVLEVVAARAARICDATDARIFLAEGEHYRHAAGFGDVGVAAEVIPLNRDTPSGRAIVDRALQHIHDIAAGSDFSLGRGLASRAGWRTILSVPLLREDRALGTIVLRRKEVRPFGDKQIELLKTFADQAAIAIENARLFNETKEALEQQTATSEILRVISGSPADIQPVFDSVIEHAMRLCDANLGTVGLYDGKSYRHVAQRGSSPEYVKFLFSEAFAPDPTYTLGRMIAEQSPVHLADYRELPAYRRGDPRAVATVELGGARTFLAVPMIKEGRVIGGITLRRPEVRPFTQKQIDLVSTFANQAVIAIENTRLFNETKEALEHQTATAEVLQVISGSVADARPVFTKILQSCRTLFASGEVGLALLGDDDMMHLHLIPEDPERPVEDWRRRFRQSVEAAHPRPARDSIFGYAMQKGQVLYYADVANGADVPRGLRESVELVGTNYSSLFSPLLWEGRGIGALNVFRVPPAPFSEEEIRLLKTFADQAVIAIQNARLFNETREALERQTATSEILRVISGSPTDTRPVFDVIAKSAMRLFGGLNVAILLRREKEFVLAGYSGPGMEDLPEQIRTAPLDPEKNFPSRAILEGRVLNVTDWEGAGVPEHEKLVARSFGIKSGLMVPLLRRGEGIGAIAVVRATEGAFIDKDIALLQSFADQAVIAIENVRLFNETKESLERQTATAEILRVIAGSPADTQPVFDAIVAACARLFPGQQIGVNLVDEEGRVHLRACEGPDRERLHRYFAEAVTTERGTDLHLKRGVAHFPDVEAQGVPRRVRDGCRLWGAKAIVYAPMMSAGRGIGAIWVARDRVGPFSEKEIALLATFADQAVIAIENVRLFKELQERTQALAKSVGQLTALGEVGRAVSSTLELDQVLRTIVQRAVQLAGLDGGSIYEFDERDERFHLRAAENIAEEILVVSRKSPIRLGEGAVGRAGATREPVVVEDVLDESYKSRVRELLIKSGSRALLAVPLLREDNLLGALVVSRKSPGPFAPEAAELLKTFATQSAVAIQNARLFREIEEKSRLLEEASRHKSQFLASMSHELRTPLNAILGFNEMILGQVYGEVPSDMKEPLEDIQKSGKHLLRLINNVLDLAKIEAGRMELALADYSVQDTVESVRATLRPLAEAKGLELVASVPQDIPLAYGDGGRITQCLMNLAGNSLKFTKEGRVEIAVEAENGLLRWRVSDTGIGIPPDKIPTLFSEFRQTDATIASEYGGTGLGLSITRKFVEMHGGRIWVESELGKGSTFMVEIPLRVKAPA